MKTETETKAKCECGSPLPVHFLEFADERFSYVCRCERKYKIENNAFVQDGFEVNPFARFDDAQKKAKKAKTKKTKVKKAETAERKER